MNNTFKKRAGRAAVAGATLLGLTATGLAFAAPASAAPGTKMVVGPVANSYGALNSTGTSLTGSNQNPWGGNLSAQAKWTYPGVGGTGPMINSAGKCLAGLTSYSAVSLATCNDTALNQSWTGAGSATNFALKTVAGAYYLNLNSSNSPIVYTYTSSTDLHYGLPLAVPVVVAPSLTSPLPGADITPGTVFSGTGSQNTVITVTDKEGKTVGTTTIGADGKWSLVLDSAPVNGTVALKVVATDTEGKSTTLADGNYKMTGSDEARAYTGPTAGAEIAPDTVFTGTGAKGESVVIKDGNGNVLGEATVGQDGHWSTTLNPVPTNGDVNLVIEITGTDGIAEQLADTNLVMTGSEEPNAYTGPKAGETVTPDTVFSGTGTKGETVTITDDKGNVLGTTEIGADGTWSLTLDPAPINGDVNLTVTIGDETVANPSVTMTGSDEAPAYSGPADGATITPETVFTGTGGKGETVTITDKDGNVLGSTTVGNDGQWSLTLDPAPKNGDVNLIVTVGGEKLADTNVVMTGSDEAPAYSGPADGATITPETVFTGTGGKGETVTITDKDGNVLGSTTVGNDGQWSLTLDPAPKNGDVNLIVTVGGEKVADTTVVMTGVDEPRALTSPESGSAITPDTEFAGTGNIGDVVKIKDKDGNVLGEATVGNDGKWSTTLSPAPTNGDTNLIIEVTGKDGNTVQLADNTYEMTDSTNAFEVLTPNLSETNNIPDGTVFTGKGEPGTTVVITDKDGNTVGQAEVDDQGNWSAPITGLPQGPNNLTITHTAPGADPVSTDLGSIVVVDADEATPLMDPAIAGGAALALLAAAGSFLMIRRRRTSTN